MVDRPKHLVKCIAERPWNFRVRDFFYFTRLSWNHIKLKEKWLANDELEEICKEAVDTLVRYYNLGSCLELTRRTTRNFSRYRQWLNRNSNLVPPKNNMPACCQGHSLSLSCLILYSQFCILFLKVGPKNCTSFRPHQPGSALACHVVTFTSSNIIHHIILWDANVMR